MTDSAYAAAPFDHAKADIILRSSDNIDFRVFKLFLSLASPVFETLLEIPQPDDPSEDQEVKDGLFVVPITENSKTLDALLRFCYPSTLADDPELVVLKDAAEVLEAAKKYALDAIERKARQAIANPTILETHPLQCFAIARQGRLREETVLSAKYTLSQPLIPTWFREIELISASDLLTLLTYHKRCGDAVHAMRNDPSWITSYYGSSEACGWLFGRYWTTEVTQVIRDDYYGGSSTNQSSSVQTVSNCGCPRSTATYQLFNTKSLQWWESFMDETFTALRDKPWRVTVKPFADRTVQTVKALNCQACSPGITEGMKDFSDLLMRKVDEVVSQIPLELDF